MEISDELMVELRAKSLWGDLELPPAIRPCSFERGCLLRRGYCRRMCHVESNTEIPALLIAEGKEQLFGLFLQLVGQFLGPGNELVQVVLGKSDDFGEQVELTADEQDVVVLSSVLVGWEDYFLKDGYTWISVFGLNSPFEIQLTEEKVIIVFAPEKLLWRVAGYLRLWGLREVEDLLLIIECDHVHVSDKDSPAQFLRLCELLNATP